MDQMLKPFHCPHCGQPAFEEAGAITRASKIGAPIYCGRACSGLARRKNRTITQKKLEKRAYDMRYRAENRAMLRRKKAEYFQRTYDPVTAAIKRKERMPYHVEYCRRPEYRVKKAEYDRQFRAREYGAFAEAHLLLVSIEREVRNRVEWVDLQAAKGTATSKRKIGISPETAAILHDWMELVRREPDASVFESGEPDQAHLAG